MSTRPRTAPRTVRAAVLDVLGHHGCHVVFGNPGTTELAFLDGLPEHIRYVLGLNESAVVAIADGYAQARGRPVLVNLHTAAGLGNAMGSLVNAHAAGSPLVVLTGQQERALLGSGGLLTNPAPVLLPLGAVKHAEEPASAEDVPAALARAFHLAALPPRGPVCVSVPMDDWRRPLPEGASTAAVTTSVTGRAAVPDDLVSELGRRLAAAARPALVVGPGADSPAGFHAAAELADRLGAPVWVPPWPHRLGFPTDHPAFQGQLPLSIEDTAAVLAPYDLVLVAGAPAFRCLTAGSWPVLVPDVIAVTDDPAQAARNFTGRTVVGDVGHTLRALCHHLAAARHTATPSALPERPSPSPVPGYSEVFEAITEVLPPDTVIVSEPSQAFDALFRTAPRTLPGSFYFTAGYGLGFATAAAVGIALADPGRPVAAVVGDGSLQYTAQALWTAAQEQARVTFFVVNDNGYGILRDLGRTRGLTSVRGLDLPGIDIVALAHAYGVPAARTACTPTAITTALRTLPRGPRLIEVPIPC